MYELISNFKLYGAHDIIISKLTGDILYIDKKLNRKHVLTEYHIQEDTINLIKHVGSNTFIACIDDTFKYVCLKDEKYCIYTLINIESKNIIHKLVTKYGTYFDQNNFVFFNINEICIYNLVTNDIKRKQLNFTYICIVSEGHLFYLYDGQMYVYELYNENTYNIGDYTNACDFDGTKVLLRKDLIYYVYNIKDGTTTKIKLDKNDKPFKIVNNTILVGCTASKFKFNHNDNITYREILSKDEEITYFTCDLSHVMTRNELNNSLSIYKFNDGLVKAC
jgi:hypothetical protein